MGYGQTLKKILKEKNMTVTELARLCGLKASTLYTCINRDTSIRYDMALPIANTLDIDVNLICKDNPYRGEEDFPPLLWEAGGLFTNMNKKKYFENQIYPVLELYDYNEYPQIYRLLVNFFVLNNTGREQIFDMLEGVKIRHTDREKFEKLKTLKEQNRGALQ